MGYAGMAPLAQKPSKGESCNGFWPRLRAGLDLGFVESEPIGIGAPSTMAMRWRVCRRGSRNGRPTVFGRPFLPTARCGTSGADVTVALLRRLHRCQDGRNGGTASHKDRREGERHPNGGPRPRLIRSALGGLAPELIWVALHRTVAEA
jgi:hypothetical protein